MNKLILFLLFPVVVVFQYYVPGRILYQHEQALQKGELVKFRTGIYDPYDPFRGRYVQLRFELSSVDKSEVEEIGLSEERRYRYRESMAYVLLETDPDGFAKVKSVSTSKPEEGIYVQTPVRYFSGGTLYIDWPFDRYFMNEKSAPEAERLYIEANRGRNREQEPWSNDNYVGVRVYQGTVALESLYVSGTKIEELLKKPPAVEGQEALQ